MSQFNLIDEAWIPVSKHDGERAELGIRDTLLKAKEIAVIEDPSPLVTAALHRFLLAVLYRALEGPKDIDQAKAWFKAGLPPDKVNAYLEQWRDRFCLFDEKYPFFQIPDFEPKTWRAWTALAAEHNADNAKVLFDHIDVISPDAVPAAAAARWLLAAQAFALGGGNSDFRYTKSAPSATAAMILPLGRHLGDTLLLSLVPQNRAVLAADLPVWERDPESGASLKSGIERAITGYADHYTWRTRSIRLRAGKNGSVSTLAFASGVENASKDGIDPMFGYRINDKKGKLPIQFGQRGLWREFDSLLPDGGELAPEVIEHATALTRFDRARFPHSLMVLGQSNSKAKIDFWRMERFALPEALIGDRSIRTEIHQLLTDAEAGDGALNESCESFARSLLAHGDRKVKKSDIDQFVKQMQVSGAYWSTLEAAFHDVLRHYTAESDPDAIRLSWLKTVRSTLLGVWRRHAASVSTSDAWAIRALVRAEAHVNRQRKALEQEIQKYETYRQAQETTA